MSSELEVLETAIETAATQVAIDGPPFLSSSARAVAGLRRFFSDSPYGHVWSKRESKKRMCAAQTCILGKNTCECMSKLIFIQGVVGSTDDAASCAGDLSISGVYAVAGCQEPSGMVCKLLGARHTEVEEHLLSEVNQLPASNKLKLDWTINDDIPHAKEIRNAVRTMKRSRCPRASGLSGHHVWM